MNKNRILVLAPHTDDGEFGCGATISKFIEEGKEVFMAAFSACEQSVLKEFPKDILITEVKEATTVLGIKRENLFLFQYQVRTFNYHRQDILDDLIKLREKIKPDLVLMPTLTDVHQDHHTIAEEALRAFKFTSILCYELPWNNLSFNSTSFVIVNENNIQQKVDALKKYRSQAHRPYANEELIRSVCRMRGVQISSHYAESFEVVRWIV
jgi:LmbE family N-acetylglucosaminyl deacetylase